MAASPAYRLAQASDTRAFGFLVSLALHAGVLAAYGLWSHSPRLIPERREEPRTVTIMRSEEHTSELQSLMRNSYAVFCLKKKKTITKYNETIKILLVTHLTVLH